MKRAWPTLLSQGGTAFALAIFLACSGGGSSEGAGAASGGTAPAFTSQPAAATVRDGQTASFTAAASGSPAPSLQWERSGDGSAWTPIAGATGTSLSFTAARSDHALLLRSRASNSHGSATSAAATLSVQWAPTITQQPASQTVAAPGSATFAIAMDSNPAAACQWQRSSDGSAWQDIPGANAPSYSTGSTASSMDNLQFRCVCSNPVGESVSQPATLRIDTAAYPLSVSLGAGVSGAPAAGGSFAAGATIDYAYTLLPGFGNLQVLLDGSAVPASGSFSMTGARALSVSASPLSVLRTVSFTAGAGGSLNGILLQSVADGGSTSAVTAVPAAGYSFVDWTGAGFATSTANPLVVSGVLQDLTITATFAPLPAAFTITASAGIYGSIAPSGVATVAPGGSITFNISADPYYVIADVQVDGASVGPVTSYTFTDVRANHTITATFY